ncbi:MAG: preprotein translocase subunit SecE [Bacteroidales bacterium]|nr:preprotein translocase subunit SecE [Bacteroidales bacterium]
MNSLITYCKESYDELVHKVTWPTYKELSAQAVLVLSASTIIALLVWLVDEAFEWLMQWVYSLFN